ncbi:MAG: sigma-70 family RNA polymerase sigma factor, partial [Phycisphaerales bacterium]|nr:sigma-70 family RNA polymerase sigma factor [Phycisphaerales bacterium]
MLSRTTQATLLARLADRDDGTAWNEFCDRYGELIRGFARRRGVQDHDCDDIVQEVLIALASAMPQFRYDPEKGRFRAYLKTATIRAVCKKSFQRNRPVSLEEMEDAVASDSVSESVDGHWEAEWRQYHLRLAMRTIEAEFNAADRSAFQLYAV